MLNEWISSIVSKRFARFLSHKPKLMLNHFKEYFSFSKKELNGLLVFCILLLLVVIAPSVYYWLHPAKAYDYKQFQAEVESFRKSEIRTLKAHSPYFHQREEQRRTADVRYFRFDPNGLPYESWKQLGLSDRQIAVIKHFEAKGGRFYKKEDLQKIYSLSAADYARLLPYVDIAGEPYKRSSYKSFKHRGARPERIMEAVEINTADSATLESLKGIGPAFASRIIKYRNRLGGFYAREQLKEVYGIDSLTYTGLQRQLVVNSAAIQQLDINQATIGQLRRYPYLSYKQTSAIIQYRRQHGPYRSAEDLKKIAILPDEVIQKILPYLIFSGS